jgi:subtilisin family serine protease
MHQAPRKVERSLKSDMVTICGQSTYSDARVTYAWDRTRGSQDVGIAILDSGIDTTHVELGGHARLLPTPSFSCDGCGMDSTTDRHGTSVAGIAAAHGDNGIGVAGVAYDCIPYGVKVANANRQLSLTTVVDGIN